MDKKPFTVVGIYHDNEQSWVGHVEAEDGDDAAAAAQIQLYNEQRKEEVDNHKLFANLGHPVEDEPEFPELEENEVPDIIRIVAVFEGHLFTQETDQEHIYQ